jgi:hypothetical protein
MNEKEVKEKSDSGLVSVHTKRLETFINDSSIIFFNKAVVTQNYAFPNASFDLPTEKPSIVLGFYMINYELKSDNKEARFYLRFNNLPVKETQQWSSTKTSCLTGAFAERQSTKSTDLSIVYSSGEDGSISEKKQQTFLIGSITLPDGPVLKSYLKNNQPLSKNSNWDNINNLFLDVSSSNVESSLYVILYTVSVEISDPKAKLGTRLQISNKPVGETLFIQKGVTKFSAHCAYAVELAQGTSNIGIQYRYDGDNAISAENKGHKVLSISAFALPKTAQLENCKLFKKVDLFDGQWRDFGFRQQIDIANRRQKSAVLVLYHVNLDVYKRELSIALSIDGKIVKNNISTSNYTERATIQGYSVHLLPEGSHTFDLKYFVHYTSDEELANQKISYDPLDKEGDEVVFMQIIVLE